MGMTKTVITVDGATSGAREIVQHPEKLVINVVRRTTSEWFANPQRDHCIEIQGKGLIGPRGNVYIDAVYMKFTKTVMMMTTL